MVLSCCRQCVCLVVCVCCRSCAPACSSLFVLCLLLAVCVGGVCLTLSCCLGVCMFVCLFVFFAVACHSVSLCFFLCCVFVGFVVLCFGVFALRRVCLLGCLAAVVASLWLVLVALCLCWFSFGVRCCSVGAVGLLFVCLLWLFVRCGVLVACRCLCVSPFFCVS